MAPPTTPSLRPRVISSHAAPAHDPPPPGSAPALPEIQSNPPRADRHVDSPVATLAALSKPGGTPATTRAQPVSAQTLIEAWHAASPADAPRYREQLSELLHTPRVPHAHSVRRQDLPEVPPTVLANDGGNISFTPREAFRPKSLTQLQDVMRYAWESGRHIKARGSLHSFAANFVTDDIMVHPEGLSSVAKVPSAKAKGSVIKAGTDTSHLMEVGSGTTIHDLNAILWDKYGMALPNMGGFDAQTLAGVVNTATHGSGLRFGPFNDIVVSFDMVLPSGETVRIERSNGPTDPQAFARACPDMRLIQDDDFFNSAVVSMGAMGVVFNYRINVRDAFYLDEVRTGTTWESIKQTMVRDLSLLTTTAPGQTRAPGLRFPADHFEIAINPYATDGYHSVTITTRNEVPPPAKTSGFAPNDRNLFYRLLHPDFSRPALEELLLTDLPKTLGGVDRIATAVDRRSAPGLIDTALSAIHDDRYVERSYNVFNVGAVNGTPAISMEVAIPLRGDAYIHFMDAWMAKVAEFKTRGWVCDSPVAGRLVRGTSAKLAAQREDCMMFELIFIRDTPHAQEMMRAAQDLAESFGGKPHPGQVNFLTQDKVKAMYGASYDTWEGVREICDPHGNLENPFTREAFTKLSRAELTSQQLSGALLAKDWQRSIVILDDVSARLATKPPDVTPDEAREVVRWLPALEHAADAAGSLNFWQVLLRCLELLIPYLLDALIEPDPKRLHDLCERLRAKESQLQAKIGVMVGLGSR